ncbi:Amylo-alpha-16-glucosidase [Hyphomicrobium denitrificans 1NES1]|uniref:Amylo-alpha-16-glucosidase n=1 Tax=Hyphomicrobium denitrificans 1NES1 TaxID=670307 RepID=N0B3H2_9HYPH|nr:amylo-alpha-1,6-glucosidase [Hyphomicrobium denitrificans]AGK58044.1 Amylo-alpha-16-glucosidase [Hyphomicrobium denitrificans 1NES1]
MGSAHSREAITHEREEVDFLISTSNGSGRAHETLKHDDAFAVIDTHGDIGAFGDRGDGFFFSDTRYLSRLELLVARNAPLLLGSTLDATDLQLCADLTNPDVYADGALQLRKDAIHIYRTSYVRDGAIRQRLHLTNHSNDDLELTVSLVFDCDFSDIFEVRGMRREKRGTVARHIQSSQSVIYAYKGLDDVIRRTAVHLEPEPISLTETAALYCLHLPPKHSAKIYFTAAAEAGHAHPSCSYVKGLRDAHRTLRRAEHETTEVSVSNPELDAVLKRAASDLRLLTTNTEDGPYPYAGTPWYSTTFGRDALITALQVMWLDPAMARGVLRRLARFQAQSHDADADAQPGKILHEMRGGEMAALREIPFGRYYGSVDSTPLFVLVAGAYLQTTGDSDFLVEIWPAVLRALDWIDGPGDPDGDGFVEYARETKSGLSNQGWKDSHDAIFHRDGSLAQGPIAIVEVQAYVYAAKVAAARMAYELGELARAENLLRQAETLRVKFERDFWCEDIGCYALALDGEKKRVDVRSSNSAHLLFTGIAEPQRAARIAQQVLSAHFFSGWGIRTIATSETRYNPMSYHNGSVWPHDNAMIAAGFSHYGLNDLIQPIFDGLLDAAQEMDQRRLPELFCGFRRRAGRAPILYPVACAPQAWASGSMLHILGSLLGLSIDAKSRTITLKSPRLPASIGAISIRRLRAGGGSADFILRRKYETVIADVTDSRGGAKVIMA